MNKFDQIFVMGLFDSWFKKKVENNGKGKDGLMDLVDVSANLKLPRVIAGYWPEIEKMKLDTISIDTSAQEKLSINQSKFGDFPILPIGFKYPQDTSGKPMTLLAQINFSEMPALEGYPRSGYLQFYISAFDDVYGLDFDNPQNQENFRVLFFEEDDVTNYQTDFSFLNELEDSENLSPIPKSYALKFSVKKEFIGMGDFRCENGPISPESLEANHPTYADDLKEYLFDHCSATGHKFGGYAYFTQQDPRIDQEQFKDYLLLLQIDSDDDIMWGDCGVANFFIHPDDLQRKDFSKVMYNWDCC